MSEIAKPARIGVRRGVTIPLGRFENERIELWAEVDLPSGVTLQEGLEDLYANVDLLLTSKRSDLIAVKAPAEAPQPDLDLEALEQLPWKPYREGHRAGWIFAEKAPTVLIDWLEREGKPFVIGEFRYRFSGPEENPKLFVSRAPVKE